MILGIDTSGPIGSMAIADECNIVSMELTVAQSHLEYLVPSLAQLLDSIEKDCRDLSGIAVGLGPGSFTGTRIGISTARALAQALRIPIVGMSSLDIIARQSETVLSHIAVAVDARRHEVYRALYANEPGGIRRLTDYETKTASQLIKECRDLGRTYLIGNGIDSYPDLGAATDIFDLAPPDLRPVKATTLVGLLADKLSTLTYNGLDEIIPVYVRPSDAELGESGV